MFGSLWHRGYTDDPVSIDWVLFSIFEWYWPPHIPFIKNQLTLKQPRNSHACIVFNGNGKVVGFIFSWLFPQGQFSCCICMTEEARRMVDLTLQHVGFTSSSGVTTVCQRTYHQSWQGPSSEIFHCPRRRWRAGRKGRCLHLWPWWWQVRVSSCRWRPGY